ncbi:MAG: hypothetical protein Q4A70_00535 [Candidatus Saccharibacteria bacterium]|nr:hypothetical protein [Candidatus Saccharibacteria bacterium]
MGHKLLTNEIISLMRREGQYTFQIETRPGFETPCKFKLDNGDIDDGDIRDQIESNFASAGKLLCIERNGVKIWPQSRAQKTLQFERGDANHLKENAW